MEKKRHLLPAIQDAMIIVFLMNLLLAAGVEETVDGLIIMIGLILWDLVIYQILKKYGRE